MAECPKAECIQASRIKGLEVEQKRDTKDFADLKKCVKEIHRSVVGNGGLGLRARVERNSIYLKLIGAAVVLIPTFIIAYVALTK